MSTPRFTAALLLASAFTCAAAELPLPEKIEFNRDVRPILSENCFKCHGFDAKKREGKRRLDTREGALADNDGFRAVVPGNLAASEVHLRVHSKDSDEQMPPPDSGKVLTDRDRAILDRWIAQGGEYQPHWAYAAVKRPEIPATTEANFVHNPIDALVLARQRALGLAHAPEADRRTLIRRLSLDLTGLPPSAAEVASFVNDPTLDAPERLVDRLLASPAYGERMAVYWLDLVRYADSIGYHSDNARNVSPFRDYVIAAFNENKPFDQFTIEQLAGDLLPKPTLSQRVASGYNRLNLTTEEGGAQAAEYEQRTVADRVRSIGTTWLAQTTGCAQCHDHKYDPIKAKDFYRLGAFFADLKEDAIGRREDGLAVASAADETRLRSMDERLTALRAKLGTPSPELAAAQLEWEKNALAAASGAADWMPLHPAEMKSEKGAALTVETGEVIRSAGGPAVPDVYRITVKTNAPRISGLRLEALASSRLPAHGPGRAFNGNFVLTEFSAANEKGEPVAIARATATFEQATFSAAQTIDGKTGEKQNGWAVMGGVGADQAIYFELAQPLTGEGEKTLTCTLRFDYGDDHVLGKFRLATTGAPAPIGAPQTIAPAEILTILKLDPAQRNEAQRAQVAAHFRGIAPLLAPLRTEIAAVEKARAEFQKTLAHCLVSESLATPRVVRLLPRGDWQNQTGEIVEPGVPSYLEQPKVDGRRLTRLDLAQWIVARENPLTARVFANRVWKLFFGMGLSKVLDDVGTQGEPPINPELLDWLASEFMESGWDVKHLVRLIVTSGTYRQSSFAPKELLVRDPFNRELARQSRFRLDAEFVRDNALAISGLLVQRTGGPSVSPYQPAGYWENLNFPVREWEASKDDNQWRRGLYTWWQRSYLHPSLVAFDAPSREECVAERTRSNIPQQALVLLNDPTYVEAARAFAERIVSEGGNGLEPRLQWAFRRALARDPRADEVATLSALWQKHRGAFGQAPAGADAVLKTGFSAPPKGSDPAELAAWTSVARVILNLHETITRS